MLRPNWSQYSTSLHKPVQKSSLQSTPQWVCPPGEPNCHFPHDDGILLTSDKHVCLTNDFKFVYTEFDYSTWMESVRQLSHNLLTLTNKLRNDFSVTYPALKRIVRDAGDAPTTTTSTTSTTSTTPAPGPAVITNDLAYISTLENLFDNFQSVISGHLGDLRLHFSQFFKHSDGKIEPYPGSHFSFRGEDLQSPLKNFIPLHNVLTLDLLRKRVAIADTMTRENRTIIVPSGQAINPVTQSDERDLDYLLHMDSYLQDTLEHVDDVVAALLQHQLPHNLYQTRAFGAAVTEVVQATKNFMTDGELRMMLSAVPLTSPYSRNCNKDDIISTPQCPLAIATMIPIIQAKQAFKLMTVETLPVLHRGVFTNDWKRLVLPEKRILVRDDDQIVPLNGNNLVCHTTPPEVFCDLCMMIQQTTVEPSDCLIAILNKQNPWKVCETEKIATPHDTAFKLSNTEFAYVDVSPGTLVEKCPNEDLVKESLLPTGLVHFNQSCTYTVTNGPFAQGTVPQNVDLIFNTKMQEIDITRHETESVLSEHWEQNGVYYFIAMSVTVGGLVITFACYCYCREDRDFRIPFRFGFRRSPQMINRRDTVPLQPEAMPMVSILERALVRADFT